jgi:hypothetical protein
LVAKVLGKGFLANRVGAGRIMGCRKIGGFNWFKITSNEALEPSCWIKVTGHLFDYYVAINVGLESSKFRSWTISLFPRVISAFKIGAYCLCTTQMTDANTNWRASRKIRRTHMKKLRTKMRYMGIAQQLCCLPLNRAWYHWRLESSWRKTYDWHDRRGEELWEWNMKKKKEHSHFQRVVRYCLEVLRRHNVYNFWHTVFRVNFVGAVWAHTFRTKFHMSSRGGISKIG